MAACVGQHLRPMVRRETREHGKSIEATSRRPLAEAR